MGEIRNRMERDMRIRNYSPRTIECYLGRVEQFVDYQQCPPGTHLSPDALQRLVRRHAAAAAKICPSLVGRTITPHTLRHSAAMDLLRRGVDVSVIALWLGHESPETTKIYVHADMTIKEKALGHASPTGVAPQRFRPKDSLLAFLEAL